jgi:hydrogenase 3 maturation protease
VLEDELFARLYEHTQGKRVLIVGVGNRLRGDDAVGGILVDRLSGKTRAALIDAGDVPENYLGVIKQAQPQLILIVDAAEIGGRPGDVALIGSEQVRPTIAWTHNPGLGLFIDYLRAELGTALDVLLLAVQPGTTTFGEGLSEPVESALLSLENLILRLV